MSHISVYRWAIVGDLSILWKKLQEFLFVLFILKERGGFPTSTLSLPEHVHPQLKAPHMGCHNYSP